MALAPCCLAWVLQDQKTYDELRRVLQKAPGGSKHVANLQGIWGCYQDARRNTEAMAFRGHRLLDQVGAGAAAGGGWDSSDDDGAGAVVF